MLAYSLIAQITISYISVHLANCIPRNICRAYWNPHTSWVNEAAVFAEEYGPPPLSHPVSSALWVKVSDCSTTLLSESSDFFLPKTAFQRTRVYSNAPWLSEAVFIYSFTLSQVHKIQQWLVVMSLMLQGYEHLDEMKKKKKNVMIITWRGHECLMKFYI